MPLSTSPTLPSAALAVLWTTCSSAMAGVAQVPTTCLILALCLTHVQAFVLMVLGTTWLISLVIGDAALPWKLLVKRAKAPAVRLAALVREGAVLAVALARLE